MNEIESLLRDINAAQGDYTVLNFEKDARHELLQTAGLIASDDDDHWALTDNGQLFYSILSGGAVPADEYEELKEAADKGAEDCKRLSNLAALLWQNMPEDHRECVVIGNSRGLEIVLSDVYKGYQLMHQAGEGVWW